MYNFTQQKRFFSVVSGTLLLGLVQLAFAGDLKEETLFDIAPQALDSALLQFSEQADIQLVVAANSLDGIETQGVSGQVSGNEALSALLQNTGLHFNVVGSTVTVTNSHTDEANESGKAQPTSEKTQLAQASDQQSKKTAATSTNREAEKTETGRNAIEEILVTARKREENLQDVPISIAAFSAADIEARSMDKLQDLANFVPNFSFFNSGTRGKSAPQAVIRGVGQNDAGITNDPGVGIYVDGIYLARLHGLNLDLLELERIEVLRGPQGTLFGKNTNGGAVNIVSVKPGNEFSGYSKIIIGQFDRVDAQASVNIPLVENKLAVKLSGLTSNRDGYGKRLDFLTGEQTGEMGDENSLSGRAQVGWTPADNLDVSFSIDGSRVRETGQVLSSPAFAVPPLGGLLNRVVDPPIGDAFLTGNPFTNFATDANTYDVDTWGTSLTIDWGLGGWNIRSITGYRELDLFYKVDLDSTPHTMLTGSDGVNQDQFSQEIQFAGTALDNRLNWLAGLYYFNEGVVGRVLADIMVPLEAFGIVISSSRVVSNDVKNYSAYSHLSYLVTDRFSLTGGLRHTYEEKAASFERSRLDGTVTVPFMTAEGDWSAQTGRAGFEYRWNDDVMGYFSAARGFKSGGLNGDPSNPTDFVAYDPEFVWTYEVGLRSDLFNRRLRFNASVFLSNYKDMQLTVEKRDPATGADLEFIGNAGKSEIKGFEADIVARPTENFSLSAAIGYIDAKYKDLDPDTALEITTETKFFNTPKWSYSFTGEYATTLGGYGDIIARLDYAYKSKVHHDVLNNPLLLQQGYGVLNGRLTFENTGGDWSLALFATNLTNKHYIMGGIDVLSVFGFASIQYAAPREWGASLKYRF